MAEAELAHQQMVKFWQARSMLKVVYPGQKERIENLVREKVGPSDYFQDMLDFGCGNGRFMPFWQLYSGHIWAVDVLDNILREITNQGVNVTPILETYPPRLQRLMPPVDLFWGCLVFQHLVDNSLFYETAAELSKVIKPGARVIILDNAVDVAAHVKPRGPEELSRALGLREGFKAEQVTINKKPNDHWLIDGHKK